MERGVMGGSGGVVQQLRAQRGEEREEGARQDRGYKMDFMSFYVKEREGVKRERKLLGNMKESGRKNKQL